MTITNTTSRKTADEMVAKLNAKYGGQTYLRFEFGAWPIGGSLDVGLVNVADDRADEACDLLLGLMAEELVG